jgi:hypothetical protein
MRRHRKRPADHEQSTARHVAAVAAGFVLLLPPLLTAFDHAGAVWGVPAIWAYLFTAWAVIIGLAALAGRGRG